MYGVLGDEEKRKVYDETGRTEDAELSGDSFKNLYEYYRGVYRAVTDDDVDAFFRTYRGSEEERADVVAAYAKFHGDMGKVFMWVMCPRRWQRTPPRRGRGGISDVPPGSGHLDISWARRAHTTAAPSEPRGAGKTADEKKGKAARTTVFVGLILAPLR